MKFLISIFLPALVLALPKENNPFKNAKDLIADINNDPYSTWKAGENFDPNLSKSYIKSLLGLLDQSEIHSLPLGEPITDINVNEIPESFDARNKWKKCKSIRHIRDQGNCGSCWAVATVSAFSDRLCISTKGKLNKLLAAQELLACCEDCGNGCNGGYSEEAWKYFKSHGIVTGGDYKTNDGCQPYSQQPCEHHVQGSRPQCSDLDPMVNPQCQTRCTNPKYHNPFSKDHKKAKSAYLIPSNETTIQLEIMKNGPVSAGFMVYEDFLAYKSGVYKRSRKSKLLGGHAVKIIGWGVEKGVKYWLVANSWNTDWGNKGLFKIIRGQNECGFESRITAGMPVNYKKYG